jgi:hypothetical protein
MSSVLTFADWSKEPKAETVESAIVYHPAFRHGFSGVAWFGLRPHCSVCYRADRHQGAPRLAG